MTDRREDILARLFVVLSAVVGIVEKVRNRGDLPSEKRPAIILMDADEVADREMFGRGRPANSPNFVVMSPEIYIVLKNQKPENETLGQSLNEYRAKVIKAVLNDATLINLVGSNGEIRYDVFVTDLGEDRTLTGKARIGISFRYPLKPNEL